jgi:hypothetical protein
LRGTAEECGAFFPARGLDIPKRIWNKVSSTLPFTLPAPYTSISWNSDCALGLHLIDMQMLEDPFQFLALKKGKVLGIFF